MEADFCIEALQEAMARYGKPEIFNTDQGSQFTSFAFTQVLKDAEVKISMDGRGRWIDNRFIERLWRSLKYERVYLQAFETGAQARRGIDAWIDCYNRDRPHSGPIPAPFRHRRVDPERGLWNGLGRRETGGVNQPAIHLVSPPRWSEKQDHLWSHFGASRRREQEPSTPSVAC
jgi:hypothetical protein